MATKFVIKLKAIHDKTGLTAYAIAKRTGLSHNTVQKYVEVDQVISDYLHVAVYTLADFYGVCWQDVVDIIEEEDASSEVNSPQPAQSMTGGGQAVGGTFVPQGHVAP